MEAVIEWMTQSTSIKPKWLPSAQEKKYLAVEEMWEYIYELLEIKRLSEDPLCQRQTQVTFEVKSLENTLQFLEMDVKQLEKTVAQLATSIAVLRADETLLLMKRELLKMHSMQLLEYVNTIKEYIQRLEERHRFMTKKSHTSRSEDDHAKIECDFIGRLKDTCNQVAILLDMLPQDTKSKCDLEKSKLSTWTSIETLSQDTSMESLLQNLTHVTKTATQNVTKLTNELNPLREMERLKYSFNNDTLQDSMRDTSVLRSVEDHIIETELNYISLNQRCCQLKRDASIGVSNSESVLTEWAQLMNSSCTDESRRIVINQCGLVEKECSGCQAAIDVLTAVSETLSKAEVENSATLKELNTKERKFKKNGQKSKKKEKLIQAIVKHNSAAKSRTLHQQSEVQTYIVQNVCSHRPDLLTLLNDLINFAHHETQFLSRLTKSAAFLVEDQQVDFADVIPDQPPQIPVYILLQIVFAILQKTLDDGGRGGSATSGKSIETRFDCKEFNDIMGLLCQWKQTQNSLGVHVASGLSAVSKTIVELSETRCILSDWWNQPAQNLVSWKSFEGMSMTEWLDQWRVLVQRYNKLFIDQSCE